MTKKIILSSFKEKFLPAEIEARDDYNFLLKFSKEEWINKVIRKIRDDEIKHIGLCKKAIEIMEKT